MCKHQVLRHLHQGIWRVSTGGGWVVYDSGSDQTLGGGSIIIHAHK